MVIWNDVVGGVFLQTAWQIQGMAHPPTIFCLVEASNILFKSGYTRRPHH